MESRAATRSARTTDIDYDVIVVGAGPAGLSVASELAGRCKVLVIDARPEQPRGRARLAVGDGVVPAGPRQVHKSWFGPHDCLYDNPGLVHCRKPHGVTRFLARTYSGPAGGKADTFDLCWPASEFGHVAPQDRYPYLDEYKLIAHWEQEILDSCGQSRILSGRFYQDHQTLPDHVEVRFLAGADDQACSETYRARLLLDASGHDSDIRKTYPDKQANVYWWTAYGALCTHPEGQIVTRPAPGHPLVVGDFMMWQTFGGSNVDPMTPVRQGRPIMEYEILDERSSFALIFYLRPEKVPLERAKSEFLNILRNEDATKDFWTTEITEHKFGYYPSGRNFRSYAQDRVDFVGDAGLWCTPCGWGATFILKNYAPYSRLLSRLIDEDRLDKTSLRSLAGKHTKDAEFFMNSVVTRFLAFGTVQQLDQFIQVFNQVDPVICERVFTLRAGPGDLWAFSRAAVRQMGLRPLLRALPPEERYQLLSDLARVVLQFGRESVLRMLGKVPERGFGVFAEK
jgi:FAD binding domain